MPIMAMTVSNSTRVNANLSRWLRSGILKRYFISPFLSTANINSDLNHEIHETHKNGCEATLLVFVSFVYFVVSQTERF